MAIRRLFSVKGEGVLTGIIWMVAVGLVSGAIAYAVWGAEGISGAASTSKTGIVTKVNDITGTTSGVGARSIVP